MKTNTIVINVNMKSSTTYRLSAHSVQIMNKRLFARYRGGKVDKIVTLFGVFNVLFNPGTAGNI